MNSWKHERNAERASSAARAISRMLKSGGFEMSSKKNKWAWTRGLTVGRVGCGNTVAINWSSGSKHKIDWERETRKTETAKAIEFIRSKGYAMDDRGWVEVFASTD